MMPQGTSCGGNAHGTFTCHPQVAPGTREVVVVGDTHGHFHDVCAM